MKKGISRHLKTGTSVIGACTSALPPMPRLVIASVVSLYCIAYSMVLVLSKLSGKNLTGNIPLDLTKLSGLVELYVQNNKLFGKVPSGLLDKNLVLNCSLMVALGMFCCWEAA
ncbi:hypothetical protein RHSIM_Rhsim05G0060000 [Rhododendron simsii]|uniref:Uncharacterized protein n=1 Tax=Rhododendron simsii TaxID=118357 RepID=A0A834LM93_RHOSS|nr:hypothetical protein RHSIM_Rhsim05G0060000 [Rhododendron simsii]